MNQPFFEPKVKSNGHKIIVVFCILMFLFSVIIPKVSGVDPKILNPPPGSPGLSAQVRVLPEGFRIPGMESMELYPNYVHLSWSVPENPITFWNTGKKEDCSYKPEVMWASDGQWAGPLFITCPVTSPGEYLELSNLYRTWYDLYFPALYFNETAKQIGMYPGEVISFRVSAYTFYYYYACGIISPPSNVVTVNIGWVTPTIKEIRVTGVPDTNNPTTNCPSTAVVEKVKLEADVDCSEHFQITKYSWSVNGVRVGEGNPCEYEAAPGTHGLKNARCSITYRNVEYGWTGRDTKTKDFKLFFVKDGHDNGEGQPPNWFTYWSEIVTPSLLGSPKPGIVYGVCHSHFLMDENVIHIRPNGASSYPAPEGLHNPLDGIDHFVWAVVHESQHYKFACDYWGNNYANYLTHVGKDGPNDDNDGDGLPNRVEDTNLNKQWDPSTEKYNWSQPLTPGAPSGILDDEEWENCLVNRDVTGEAYKKLDFANPGKQTTQAATALLRGVLADEPASDGPPDLKLSPSPTATFSGVYSDRGIDVDSDGSYDFLEVNAELNVTVAGNYVVSGGLRDIGGNVWFGSNEAQLSVGPQTVSLRFDGLGIHNARNNGPYTLVDLVVCDENSSLHDFAGEAFNTSAYQYGEFEGPATQFSGVFSDHGADVDGDGVYDSLSLDVGVSSTVSANSTVEGCLCDSLGNVISNARDAKLLDVGSSVFSLNFDGLSIFASRTNGPYSVRCLNLCYENGTQADFIYDAYNTSALSHAGFGGAKAMFTGAYENRTLDVNADGLFEYLTIGVNVTAKVSGNYTVAGSLCDCNGTIIADASSFGYLNSSQTPEVFLTFSGFPIHENGVDGPYTLSHLTLYDENGTVLDGVDNAYNTSAYLHTEFTIIPEFPMPLLLSTFMITTLIAVVIRRRTRGNPYQKKKN